VSCSSSATSGRTKSEDFLAEGEFLSAGTLIKEALLVYRRAFSTRPSHLGLFGCFFSLLSSCRSDVSCVSFFCIFRLL
jgi:hypothetical protein